VRVGKRRPRNFNSGPARFSVANLSTLVAISGLVGSPRRSIESTERLDTKVAREETIHSASCWRVWGTAGVLHSSRVTAFIHKWPAREPRGALWSH